jgi:hypothetical protein
MPAHRATDKHVDQNVQDFLAIAWQPISAMKRCSASWAYSDSVESRWDLVCESTMKSIGKQDEEDPHVRFDE